MNGTFITLFVMKVPFITLADAPRALPEAAEAE
jgi:hypothetical protein